MYFFPSKESLSGSYSGSYTDSDSLAKIFFLKNTSSRKEAWNSLKSKYLNLNLRIINNTCYKLRTYNIWVYIVLYISSLKFFFKVIESFWFERTPRLFSEIFKKFSHDFHLQRAEEAHFFRFLFFIRLKLQEANNMRLRLITAEQFVKNLSRKGHFRFHYFIKKFRLFH